MAVIDYVLNTLVNILQNNDDKIVTAYNARGGMEGWFQVELLYGLSVQGLAVEREVPIFNNERCDFAISNGAETIYVELKVETEEGPNMAMAYEADVQKMEELQRYDQTGYAILVTRNTYPGSLPEENIVATVHSARGGDSSYIFVYPN